MGIKRGARTAAGLLAPQSQWHQAMFAARYEPFSRDFFPVLLPSFEASYLHNSIVKVVEQKRGALASGSGILFLIFFRYRDDRDDPTEKEKRTHLLGATTIFCCRHFLAEDDASRNNHGRANGVHNLGVGARGGCRTEVEDRRVRCSCVGHSSSSKSIGF